MQRNAAPLEASHAIGRLEPGGAWIGFGFRGGTCRVVVGGQDWMDDGPADDDLALALAIAHFAGAFGEPPPDLEATQSDLATLVRRLMDSTSDPSRRALLREAVDAIDDGLAGDAVAETLAAARSPQDDAVDPVERLQATARRLASDR